MDKFTKKGQTYIIFSIIIFCLLILASIVSSTSLNDLDDVTISSASEGEHLIFVNATANWTNTNMWDRLNLSEDTYIWYDSGSTNFTFNSKKQFKFNVNNDKTAFWIDDDGIYDTRYQPSARARLTSSQSVNSGIWTKLILDNEDYDKNSDYSTVNARFDVPKEGLYHICYSVRGSPLSDTDTFKSAIYVNGAMAGGFVAQTCSVGLGDEEIGNSGSDILSLNPNDYIEIYVEHSHFPSASYGANTAYNYIAVNKVA